MRKPRLILAKDGRLTGMNDDLITPDREARMFRFVRKLVLPQLLNESGQSLPGVFPCSPWNRRAKNLLAWRFSGQPYSEAFRAVAAGYGIFPMLQMREPIRPNSLPVSQGTFNLVII